MDSRYENFYEKEEKDYYSSDENQQFQAYDHDDFISQFQIIPEFKKSEINIIETQSTFYSKTNSQNFEHIRTFGTFLPTNQTAKQSIIIEKIPEPNKDNKRTHKIIQTSMYKLEKNAMTYKGWRQETVNLNKFFRSNLRQHLQVLYLCQILNPKQFEKYQNGLQANNIIPSNIDENVLQKCKKYVQSSYIVKNLLSSRLNISNKIISLKYLQKLRHKLKHHQSQHKGWKSKII